MAGLKAAQSPAPTVTANSSRTVAASGIHEFFDTTVRICYSIRELVFDECAQCTPKRQATSNAMYLKPRLANTVGMLLGGCVLAFLGMSAWIYVGGFAGLMLGAFGVLGVVWVVFAVLALTRRRQLGILIDESGLEFPAFRLYQSGSSRVRILREDIVTVSKHESIKGRLIEISTSRGPVLLQARHYCELDEFISHCRNYGLSVA